MPSESLSVPGQLRARIIKTASISPGPWQYGYLPEYGQRALTRTIEARGQLKPIYVRSLAPGRYEVIDGHRILEALRRLQERQAWVLDFGPLSNSDASLLCVELRYNYGDYKTHMLAKPAELDQFMELRRAFSHDLLASRLPVALESEHIAHGVQGTLANALGPRGRKLGPQKAKLSQKLCLLKGARLAIWIAYCLKVDGRGRARLSREELATLTGYRKRGTISTGRRWLVRSGWLVPATTSQPRESADLQPRKKGTFSEVAYTPVIPGS